MENTSNTSETILTNHDNINQVDIKEVSKITLNEVGESNTKNETENNNSSNTTSSSNLTSSSTNSNTEKLLNPNNSNNNLSKETIDSENNPNLINEQLPEAAVEANSTEDQNNHPETVNSHDDSVLNASTEVNTDISISDRLAGLNIEGEIFDNSQDNHSTLQNSDESNTTNAPDIKQSESESEKPEKSAELTRSILAGEVSDNSERSVDVDGDEDTDYDDDKAGNGDASDEEMFIEDQDEDVEEEEEFHEVEEEKHKTSQESVGSDKTPSSPPSKVKSPGPSAQSVNASKSVHSPDGPEERSVEGQSNIKVKEQESTESKVEVEAESKPDATKNTDWADIMLSSNQSGDQLEEKVDDENTQVEVTTKATEEAGEDTGEKKKELDLDEDVKNPQYIPKKGVFYEHDDRSHDVNNKKQPSTSLYVKKDEETVEAKDSASSKKSGPQEKPTDNRRGNRRQRTENDRWNHDLYKDEKQKPKSKSELITAYGYDIRQERTPRNHSDNRPQRASNNNTNPDRQHVSQDNQRSRQIRDNRTPRQNQPLNRSKEPRPRRQTNRNRSDIAAGNSTKREEPRLNNRLVKPEIKDGKNDVVDSKQGFQPPQTQSSLPPNRRDQQDSVRDRNVRNENRGRLQHSNERQPSNSVDDKLPPINTVMPPITTWSNKIEDMVKEEAIRKQSPSRPNNPNQQSINSSVKGRSNDCWPQNQQNKGIYHERPARNPDENRHQQQQHYNSRRYQDRDEVHKTHFVNRNHYNDRTNQHHQEWRRANHYNNSYVKPNEFEPIKTQTFENSRLAQANLNRFSSFRDARDIINERRIQGQQQSFQTAKVQQSLAGPDQQHQQRQLQHQQQQLVHQQQQILQHQHLLQQQQQQQQQPPPPPQQQQASQHMRQHQAAASQQQPIQNQTQQPQQSSQTPQIQNQQLQNHRQHQPHQATQPQPQQQLQAQQPRHNLVLNNIGEGVQEPTRLNASASNANDPINSRPIIKTDAYTGANVAPHSQQTQPLQQHSQNHRSLGGPMSQQGPSSAASHLLPSHLNAGGAQAQYYTPSGSSRDSAAAAAALATAYHGYIPSGHSVMDATRYHMTSQQLSDHGYLASPGQTNDVATASVLHQQGMYTDAASAGGTVASSAYLAQAGSTLSPSTNIPVTGTGPPPIAPVSYLQHSQYAHPPYSNPYSQPQHNQAPPQSSHPYSPYWTYI